jgi:hypothetical protein
VSEGATQHFQQRQQLKPEEGKTKKRRGEIQKKMRKNSEGERGRVRRGRGVERGAADLHVVESGLGGFRIVMEVGRAAVEEKRGQRNSKERTAERKDEQRRRTEKQRAERKREGERAETRE